MFKVGDIIQYHTPMPDEIGLVLEITEWNGDRGYAKSLTSAKFPDGFGMNIAPVTLVYAKDIEKVAT